VAETPDAELLDFAHMLFDLAREGDADRLAGYLEAGLSPNLTNDKGDTLLILAAYRGHADAVRVLVEHGADVARANDRGQTALAAGVFKQSEPTVRVLLAAGADPTGGQPSARETAQFFELSAMLALLEEARETR
jgi:uncharacterized protein